MIVYRVDKEWWDAESRKIVGDMGFTCSEADETRTTDLNALMDSVSEGMEYAKEEGEYSDRPTKDFAIYEIQELEIEDDEDIELAQILDYKTIAIFPCCPRRIAEMLLPRHFRGVEMHPMD